MINLLYDDKREDLHVALKYISRLELWGFLFCLMKEGEHIPYLSKKPCGFSSCPNLTRERFCAKHKKQEQQRQDKERDQTIRKLYDHKWRKARLAFLNRNPLCSCDDCKKRAVPLPANVVDHRIAHKGDINLFWNANNWQAMNKRCHDRKTAIEDGAFGKE